MVFATANSKYTADGAYHYLHFPGHTVSRRRIAQKSKQRQLHLQLLLEVLTPPDQHGECLYGRYTHCPGAVRPPHRTHDADQASCLQEAKLADGQIFEWQKGTLEIVPCTPVKLVMEPVSKSHMWCRYKERRVQPGTPTQSLTIIVLQADTTIAMPVSMTISV